MVERLEVLEGLVDLKLDYILEIRDRANTLIRLIIEDNTVLRDQDDGSEAFLPQVAEDTKAHAYIGPFISQVDQQTLKLGNGNWLHVYHRKNLCPLVRKNAELVSPVTYCWAGSVIAQRKVAKNPVPSPA